MRLAACVLLLLLAASARADDWGAGDEELSGAQQLTAEVRRPQLLRLPLALPAAFPPTDLRQLTS